MKRNAAREGLALAGGMLALVVSLGTLLAPAAQAQAPTGVNIQDIDAFLQKTLADNRVPGLSVVVVQDDRIVFMKGYGQAGGGRPVTPQTPFYLGSTSKTITALAVMQLVEQGKVELDAPVERYLPWFQVADQVASRQITVRHLLNHTSGLSESADPGSSNLSPTLNEQIRRMRSARLTAPVGTKFQYDSQNYRTLGLLIEQVTGQAYGDYVRDHVFAPLEMTHSLAGSGQAPGLAQGYSQAFSLPFPRPEKFQPASQSSGYIISSAEDMGHYLIAMLNQGRYAGRSVVQPHTVNQMMTPPPGINSQYGFGWLVSSVAAVTKAPHNDRIVFHGGSLPNFHSFALLLPEKRLGFAFLCNQNGIIPMFTWSQKVKRGMISLLLGEPAAPSASYSWIGWLVGAFAILTWGLQVRSIVRLPQWESKVSRQSRPMRWFRTLVDLVIPAAVLAGVGWRMPYALLPDVTLWVFAACALSVVRGIAKLVLVVPRKPPALEKAV
jgi:CubicO group peptidase (beta-lactamase class C family)